MLFQWKQCTSKMGEMRKWVLIHKDTGKTVLEIHLSCYGEDYWSWKVRRKILRAYEMYYGKVCFNMLRFF